MTGAKWSYYSVEFASFVARGQFRLRRLVLARAELAEILSCLWVGVGEEMDLDAAERFAG